MKLVGGALAEEGGCSAKPPAPRGDPPLRYYSNTPVDCVNDWDGVHKPTTMLMPEANKSPLYRLGSFSNHGRCFGRIRLHLEDGLSWRCCLGLCILKDEDPLARQ